METIENNKLIAEFMGAVCEMVDHTEGNEDYCKSEGIDKWLIPTWSKPEGYNENKWGWGKYRMGHFEYNESWDWLMPVVEKIENTSYKEDCFYIVHVNFLECTINDSEKDDLIYICEIGQTKLEATYKAVIEFIKWHNENNK